MKLALSIGSLLMICSVVTSLSVPSSLQTVTETEAEAGLSLIEPITTFDTLALTSRGSASGDSSSGGSSTSESTSSSGGDGEGSSGGSSSSGKKGSSSGGSSGSSSISSKIGLYYGYWVVCAATGIMVWM